MNKRGAVGAGILARGDLWQRGRRPRSGAGISDACLFVMDHPPSNSAAPCPWPVAQRRRGARSGRRARSSRAEPDP
eukprot:1490687-Pyramimonas_sp.AAC.1